LAIDAVRQWVYEPMVVDGQPKEAAFTVTVRFQLKNGGKKLEKDEGTVSETGEVRPPRIIKKVEPVYPKEARQAGIQGTVILEAMIDTEGNVIKARVLESIPDLDQAAIDALKQWKYEPVFIDGKPKPIVFTVTIRFQLR
jgi:TonB family protein